MEFSGTLRGHVSITSALGTIFLLAILSFLFKLYRVRSIMLELRRQGLVWSVNRMCKVTMLTEV